MIILTCLTSFNGSPLSTELKKKQMRKIHSSHLINVQHHIVYIHYFYANNSENLTQISLSKIVLFLLNLTASVNSILTMVHMNLHKQTHWGQTWVSVILTAISNSFISCPLNSMKEADTSFSFFHWR